MEQDGEEWGHLKQTVFLALYNLSSNSIFQVQLLTPEDKFQPYSTHVNCLNVANRVTNKSLKNRKMQVVASNTKEKKTYFSLLLIKRNQILH